MNKFIEILVKVTIKILTIILIITTLVGAVMIFNPVSRTNEGVRRYLLRIMPIGIAMEDVIRIAEENEKWSNISVREGFGVVINPIRMSPVNRPPDNRDIYVVGETSIRIYLGRAFLISDVSAFFAFDENGELIEIFVHRGLAL